MAGGSGARLLPRTDLMLIVAARSGLIMVIRSELRIALGVIAVRPSLQDRDRKRERKKRER